MEVGNKQRALTVLAGIMTVLLALTGIEVLARHEFYISQTSAYSCMVLDDVSTGARGVPNSTCWEKYTKTNLSDTISTIAEIEPDRSSARAVNRKVENCDDRVFFRVWIAR